VLSRQMMEPLTGGEVTPVRATTFAEPASTKTMADAEREHITATLRETKWVVGGPRGAAVRLGLPRTTLLARMQRLGISSEASRSRPGRSLPRFEGVVANLSTHSNDDAAADLRLMEAATGA
jgi:hypothetical protein